ncbi:MAG: hypothetical protein ACT4OV_16085 [Microthrixaceae bacterium]
MIASLSAAVAAAVLVAAAPADATVPPKKTVTRVSGTFTCLDTQIGFIGGGTLTGLLRRTPLRPLEGETSRTHVEGKYRFVAENGERRTYVIDYIRNYSESRGSAIWDGRFLVDDVSTQNYWYADPGEVEFGDGGYAFGGPPWRSVCDELGYPTGLTQ